ncbi:MAG: tetratricopeptide repeat protein [Planctomycetota bacterium]
MSRFSAGGWTQAVYRPRLSRPLSSRPRSRWPLRLNLLPTGRPLPWFACLTLAAALLPLLLPAAEPTPSTDPATPVTPPTAPPSTPPAPPPQNGSAKTDLQWGDDYFAAGDYKNAAASYAKVIAADAAAKPPVDLDTQFVLRYIEVLRTIGEYQKALDFALAHQPPNPHGPAEWRVICTTGDLEYFLGDPAQAEALYKKGAADGDLRAQLCLKRLYIDTGRRDLVAPIVNRFYDFWDQNRNDLNDDAKADPDTLAIIGAVIWDDNPDAPDDALNLCYARAEKIAKARHTFEPEYYLWSGQMAIDLFNFPLARDEFSEVLKQRKNDPDANFGLARILFDNGRFDEALKQLDLVLQVNPNHVPARALAVACHLADENGATKPDAIEKELLALRKISPTNVETLGLLYANYLIAGDDRKAFDTEKAMRKINPHPGEFYCVAGEALERSRIFIQSGDLYKKAVEASPNSWRAHFDFAQNRRRLGDEITAQKEFEISFKLNQYNVFAVNMKRSLAYLIGAKNTDGNPIAPDYVTHETEHFILRVHSNEDKILAPYYLSILEEVRTRLDKEWGYDPVGFSHKKILVEIFPTMEDFAASTIGLPSLDALGCCFGPTVTLVSPKIAIQHAQPYFNWEHVFEHEYTHCITLQMSGYKVPRWFTEGCSTHEEHAAFLYWDPLLINAWHQKMLLPISKINAGFTDGTVPNRIQLSYYQGKLILDHIVKTYGIDAVKKILLAYKAGKNDVEAIQEGTGVKPDVIDKDVNAEIATLVSEIKLLPEPMPSDLTRVQENLKAHPNDVKAQEAAAVLMLQIGQADPAAQYAHTLYNTDPKNAVANKVLGLLAYQGGNAEVARAYLQAAVAANPDDFRAWKDLGQIYHDAAQMKKAIDAWQKAIALYPRCSGDDMNHANDTYNLLADAQVQEGDKKGAIETLSKCIAIDTTNYPAAESLAKLQLEAKDYAAAVQAALDCIYINPYDVEVHLTAGAAYAALKDTAHAEREYNVVTTLDKTRIDAWIGLAQARFDAQNFSGAEVADSEALNLDAQNADALALSDKIKTALKNAAKNELGDN